MINIREVAKIAGVSPSTVSRVINGSAKVSPEKTAKVLQAISNTDYIPNEVARSLYRKSAKLIGLIIPSIKIPILPR
jgi:DNA-binding LacI/PurR family transcriptional regulator